MSTPTTAVEKSGDKPMEFVPFGAVDKIKLTVAIIQNIVCIPTKSGKICSARDALRFMMLCQAQRLNPFAGDCFMCGYDSQKYGAVFSLITAHQTFLKRAETCADFEGMESGVILVNEENVCNEREGDLILENETCIGGWAKVYRKGRKPTYRRSSIAAMRPNYETNFWDNKFKAAAQIVKCAEADALRSTFPTLLGGLYTGEQLNMSATISSTGVMDIPPDAAPAALIQASQPVTDETKPEPQPREKVTPQKQLEGKVLELGGDFETFRKFLEASGIIADAGSLASFEEIQTDDAKRVLRLTDKTMTDGLANAKKGAK